ncbi:MAG: heavy metal translocating P-type ATPase metal-binding domain-containing protein [Myxococcota bacterium]
MPFADSEPRMNSRESEPAGSSGEGRCVHCRSPIPADAGSARFCCRGCEAVHGLLLEQGLSRYYELAGDQVAPVTEATTPTSHAWLEPLLEQAKTGGAVCSLQLDVQGIHCAACVWLMNETFKRQAGAGNIVVNPALGTVSLTWKAGELDVAKWVEGVEGFGYRFGPARKKTAGKSIELPLRLGVSAALAINVMLFSVSFHFGLSPKEPQLFELFTWLSLALSTAVVVIGGWPFLKAALRGLRTGVLHLDLPIAGGIVLVYGMSLVQLFASKGRGDLAYFDTLNTFITLMLLGRFLQDRLLEKNRRYLLEDDGADGIIVRRVVGERLEAVPAPKVAAGDVLLVAPGDLVPVEAALLDAEAQVSTDWITGEPEPRRVERGRSVPAGSFNAGRAAFHVQARTDFPDSPLVALLRQPAERADRKGGHQVLWNRVAKRWVVTVLAVAALGFLLWLPKGVGPAINVAVALLVITCPCAIGIAIPLAYELMQARLRRQGFFARSPDLLDRLTQVKAVLFDKTGTLTLGRLDLADPEPLRSLPPAARDVAWNLAVRSSHPVSRAVARALEGQARYDVTAAITEAPGKGLEWIRADGRWRLGRADWALEGEGEGARGAVLSKDGRRVVSLETREALRPDARREVEGLRASKEVWLLSGDVQGRVSALAASLGVPGERALGGLTPEAKAEAVRRIDRQDTLFVGDGVNDSLAFEAAFCAGTPAVDRPVMPSRSDFFLIGEGLAPVQQALAGALHLRGAVQRILGISLAYNLVAIAASLLGLMSPVAAAISMPASTLTLIFYTVATLRRAPPASDSRFMQAAQFSRPALEVGR